jgi:hypothetical protein
MLFRLFPDGHDIELYVNIQTDRYQAIPLYRSDAHDASLICAYVEQIADDLFVYSGEYDHLAIFVGDESCDLTIEETSRLFSVGDAGTYYKIDHDNDGTPEYFSKYLSYPSTYYQMLYLDFEFYELRSSVVGFDPGYQNVGLPYQLWFKTVGGNVYTLRLMRFNVVFVVNAFLLEGDAVRQICTYLLAPQQSLSVYEEDTPEFRG